MTTVFYLPCGTKNLSGLFPINWLDVQSYTVEAVDSIGVTCATTPLMVLHSCSCIRIHFVNYLGCMDAVDFIIVEKLHESKSDQYQQPQQYPLDKTQHSIGRINISANDSYTVQSVDYGEKDMAWLDELADTPAAWIEWGGGQLQPASFLPIVINDAKKVNRKQDNRYAYQLNIDFVMSNPRIPLNN